MTNPKEQEMVDRIKDYLRSVGHVFFDEKEESLISEFAGLLHSDREAVMESSKKISYIYPDFDRNGLVRETADKINEIIDAVNLLSPNK